MPAPRPDVLEFLLTRRSRPAKTLSGPFPTRADLEPILTAAARTPDHGKLEPWRFMVLLGSAPGDMVPAIQERGAALTLAEEQIAKAASAFADAGCIVTVVEVRRSTDKVPAVEQTYSAGAVCLALLNAALASGWGANWLTGWVAHDAQLGAEAFGLAPGERIAGFIHIGTETSTPPERPRPELDSIVEWRGL